MRGKKLINVDKLNAGDIGAMAKLQYTNTGVYYLSNQPVYCLAKHYDYSSQSWWILCRIFDGNAAQYVWAQSQAFYSPDWLLSRLAEE